MSRIAYNTQEKKLLARLMRAEAEGEGQLGMLLVGNVCVNRVAANCLDFKDINTVERMVFQKPGGFEATHKNYFYQAAREKDIRLAERVLKGERFEPATDALWFYNPFENECKTKWWGQWNSGRYKSHCFYAPVKSENCF